MPFELLHSVPFSRKTVAEEGKEGNNPVPFSRNEANCEDGKRMKWPFIDSLSREESEGKTAVHLCFYIFALSMQCSVSLHATKLSYGNRCREESWQMVRKNLDHDCFPILHIATLLQGGGTSSPPFLYHCGFGGGVLFFDSGALVVRCMCLWGKAWWMVVGDFSW